jgi:uncharacterized protein YegP (UPF0339 family)
LFQERSSLLQFIVYKDTEGRWRWHLLANNDRTIAVSSESYAEKADCLNIINEIKATAQAIAVVERQLE